MQTIADHPDIERIERTGYLYDSKLLGVCEECEFEITEGYEMYEYEGEILCKECVRRIKKVAVYCDWCGKEFDPIEDGFFQFDKELVCPECVEEDCKCCDE